MSGPDLDRLAVLSSPDDRLTAPYFVGRQELIGNIESQLDTALASVRAGIHASGLTLLVQGAPGAGKTSLLGHLVERWKTQRDAPLALSCSTDGLGDTGRVVERIAKRVSPRRARKLRRSGNLIIDFADMLGIGVRLEHAFPPPDFWTLERILPPRRWTRPLCLMVDEIQNMDTDRAGCLQALHEGLHGLPIVLLCTGLGNSQDVLARAGLSRLASNAVHGLANLAKEEAMAAILRFLHDCRVETDEGLATRWAEVIATRSDAWPQFVRTEMAALAGGLVTAKGVLADVDDEAVRRTAERLRNTSYEARLSDELREAMSLVATVMAEVPPEGLDLSRVLGAIRRHTQPDNGPDSRRLPRRMEPEQLLYHMIHMGALQRRQESLLACPIPGFRTWLIQQGELLS